MQGLTWHLCLFFFQGFFLQEHVFNEVVFFFASDNNELSYFISLLVVINHLSNSSTCRNFYLRSRCQTKTSQLPTETFMVLVLYSFKESYPSSVHRALRYDQSPLSGPPKVRDLLIFVRNLLPSVNNRTKQARFSQK